MIPEGKYTAMVDDHKWGKTKKGDMKLDVRFQVIGGDHDNAVVFWNGYFSGKATEHTLKSLRHCGWVGDDLAELGALDKQVEIVVEHNEWEGKTYAKVRFVNEIGGGGMFIGDQLSGDEIRQFAASMKSTIAGMAAPANGTEVAAEVVPDDEIPF